MSCARELDAAKGRLMLSSLVGAAPFIPPNHTKTAAAVPAGIETGALEALLRRSPGLRYFAPGKETHRLKSAKP
jgi:hypothetical protein